MDRHRGAPQRHQGIEPGLQVGEHTTDVGRLSGQVRRSGGRLHASRAEDRLRQAHRRPEGRPGGRPDE
eukprot:5562032-Pyramimonas_sp.AAC.1